MLQTLPFPPSWVIHGLSGLGYSPLMVLDLLLDQEIPLSDCGMVVREQLLPLLKVTQISFQSFPPSGSRLAFVSEDNSQNMGCITGAPIRVLATHPNNVFSMVFLLDGTEFACELDDRIATEWVALQVSPSANLKC